MKQNIFSKKNQLDEMQEQTLRKIESRGFWLMWWGLFVVMIFQLMMQADISQMAGEWIAVLLPFTLPASVISLILLLILLLSGGVKERTIQGTSHFLIDNMGLFFIPSVVGTLEYLDVLKLQFVPFLVVSLVSTPLVYAATAWSVRLLMKLFHAKEASHD